MRDKHMFQVLSKFASKTQKELKHGIQCSVSVSDSRRAGHKNAFKVAAKFPCSPDKKTQDNSTRGSTCYKKII